MAFSFPSFCHECIMMDGKHAGHRLDIRYVHTFSQPAGSTCAAVATYLLALQILAIQKLYLIHDHFQGSFNVIKLLFKVYK